MDTGTTPLGPIEVRVVPPGSTMARRAQRDYLEDVAARYYGRPATPEEMESALAEHPVDDLAAPDGVFLVASDADWTIYGCVGLARVEGTTGEVRRLHVPHPFRGQGLGRRLMTEVEVHARRMKITHLQLDTRRDLTESQRLYESLGYRRTAAHSGGPYAEVWYSKTLT